MNESFKHPKQWGCPPNCDQVYHETGKTFVVIEGESEVSDPNPPEGTDYHVWTEVFYTSDGQLMYLSDSDIVLSFVEFWGIPEGQMNDDIRVVAVPNAESWLCEYCDVEQVIAYFGRESDEQTFGYCRLHLGEIIAAEMERQSNGDV